RWNTGNNSGYYNGGWAKQLAFQIGALLDRSGVEDCKNGKIIVAAAGDGVQLDRCKARVQPSSFELSFRANSTRGGDWRGLVDRLINIGGLASGCWREIFLLLLVLRFNRQKSPEFGTVSGGFR